MPLLAAGLAGCTTTPLPSTLTPAALRTTSWDDLLQRARNTTVAFSMWSGEEDRNRLFRGSITETLQQRHGITLRVVPYSDTAEVITKLVNERSAGRATGGSIDMVWINGENFRSARQGNVLWGPFADTLPNVRLYPDAARQQDFGTPVEGYEAPWQRAQFVFAHDTARVPQPPRSIPALRTWVQAHPGRFTYIAPPDFTGSAFIRHILLAFGDNPAAFQRFDESHYTRASAKALAYLNDLRPALWRKGETYPANLREQDRLFANQEIDFAMSYGPAFASVRIAHGEYPPTTRTFVFDTGTIANYSFLAIPFNAANVRGALTVINHLMSFEQLLELSRTLNSPFPLDLGRLTATQRQQVAALPRGVATLPDDVLAAHAIPEPHADYLSRFEKDWQDQVLRQ